jgi:hypothetical protein
MSRSDFATYPIGRLSDDGKIEEIASPFFTEVNPMNVYGNVKADA